MFHAGFEDGNKQNKHMTCFFLHSDTVFNIVLISASEISHRWILEMVEGDESSLGKNWSLRHKKMASKPESEVMELKGINKRLNNV